MLIYVKNTDCKTVRKTIILQIFRIDIDKGKEKQIDKNFFLKKVLTSADFCGTIIM